MTQMIRWWKGFDKPIQAALGWLIVLGAIGFLGYALWRFFAFDEAAWQVFINAKFAQALVQVCFVALVMFALDAVTPKNTIRTILCIDQNALPDNKRTAALFLLGCGAIAAYMLTRSAF